MTVRTRYFETLALFLSFALSFDAVMVIRHYDPRQRRFTQVDSDMDAIG